MKSFLKFVFNGFLAICIFILFQITKVFIIQGEETLATIIGIGGFVIIVFIGWLVNTIIFKSSNQSENKEKRNNKIGYEVVEEKNESSLPYGKNSQINTETLPFKDNNKAFEYAEKFFKINPINTQSAFVGLMAMESLALINVDDNGDKKRVYVFVDTHPENKTTIKVGDLVHVGVSDIGKKLVTVDDFLKVVDGIKDKENLAGQLAFYVNKELPKGYILRKLRPILDISTSQFYTELQ